jgi:predicted small secreted protein
MRRCQGLAIWVCLTAATLAGLLNLGGCNTVEGMGKDLEAAGKGTSKAADQSNFYRSKTPDQSNPYKN